VQKKGPESEKPSRVRKNLRAGINGFGRIGRSLLRALYERDSYSDLKISVINSPGSPRTLAHLLKYDSTYGTFPFDVTWEPDAIVCRGQRIPCISETDPSEIDWSAFDVDLVIECSGRAREREVSQGHISSGAPRVLISASSHEPDITLIPGCNVNAYNPSKHKIVSMGSCTSNCLCPIIKVLTSNFKVENGFATAIHSYTSDQRILDGTHEDLRRARAAGQSLIPTKTGASQALSSVFPELKGKIRCVAVRVPTSTVSLLDLVVQVERDVTGQIVNEAFAYASQNDLQGILAISKEPLVSIDYRKDPHSSTVDALSTATSGHLIRVLAWYDNEWAYSLRLIDTALIMGRIWRGKSGTISSLPRIRRK
jgi:glyceraldehyde 3-phosphate dehydrogenase